MCRAGWNEELRVIGMNEATRTTLPDLKRLPNITFRQLEVFCVVCHEGSYANAAVDLRCSRSNVKRVCEEFQAAVESPLFTEAADRTLQPTPFALALLGQVTPLSRSLRRLGDTVRNLHEIGRMVRFAAAGEFFKGGLFTEFLARLAISDHFRPCFLRIETKRLRTALLNAECDVYFGAGILASDRLESVDLGPVPWRIEGGKSGRGTAPASPKHLPHGKWWIASIGQTTAAEAVLADFHAAGAAGGRILEDSAGAEIEDDHLVFAHDVSGDRVPTAPAWPCYRFTAVLRKNHPYSELFSRLADAALP